MVGNKYIFNCRFITLFSNTLLISYLIRYKNILRILVDLLTTVGFITTAVAVGGGITYFRLGDANSIGTLVLVADARTLNEKSCTM
jgi:hypothetical protein